MAEMNRQQLIIEVEFVLVKPHNGLVNRSCIGMETDGRLPKIIVWALP